MTGARGFHAGRAAEDSVCRHYIARGARLIESRWRGPAGEIDLIFAMDGHLVFVEVKSAATLDAALARLSPRQLARIAASADHYAARLPELPHLRLDLAAVDGTGRVEVIENVSL